MKAKWRKGDKEPEFNKDIIIKLEKGNYATGITISDEEHIFFDGHSLCTKKEFKKYCWCYLSEIDEVLSE